MLKAVYFDGRVALDRAVEVVATPSGLTLHAAGNVLAVWPAVSLRELDARAGEVRIRSIGEEPLAHLVLRDQDAIAQLRAAYPALPADDLRYRTPVLKIIGLSLAAAGSVFAAIVFIVPLMAGVLAGLVPPAFERQLGQQIAGQLKSSMETKACQSPAGSLALGKLSAKLGTASGLPVDVSIEVLDSRQKNAVALPGGIVFLFDGLLASAENVDEIAGVLGHELGHQATRDGLKGFFRAGGSAFLLGLLFGDVSGSWAVVLSSQRMIEAAHSREAERAADMFARDVMHELRRPAAEMAKLLVRLTGNAEKGIFDSHPLSAERLERLRAADSTARVPLTGEPLLTEGEWLALRKICSDD